MENSTPENCFEVGRRVFNVFINGQLQLEGFDIFAAVGCHTSHEVTIPYSIGSVNIQPLSIRLASVVGFAQLQYLRIVSNRARCIPVEGEVSSDHSAHAVPGSYPPRVNGGGSTSYVDRFGVGFVEVTVNGKIGSHTHFVDSSNKLGEIISYEWTNVETGELMSSNAIFSFRFPLGTTRLKLAVVDESCATDEAETSITVVGTIQAGQYCYYYNGLEQLPIGGALNNDPKPVFAAISLSSSLGFPEFSFDETLFAVRCQFFLEVNEENPAAIISIDTSGSGDAQIFKGGDLLVDSRAVAEATTSLSFGLTAFEVVYLRTSIATIPRLTFRLNGAIPSNQMISHDQKTVLPILSSVSPHEGTTRGNDRLVVTGFGLYQPLSVTFGGRRVQVLSGATDTQFSFRSLPAASENVVSIIVSSSTGAVSNALFFEFASMCDAVGFEETELTTSTGESVDTLQSPTCSAFGQDGRIYIGTLGGTVQVLGYNADTLVITSHCYSKNTSISDPNFVRRVNGVETPSVRDILGITFDPRDRELRPYVSASTLFWFARRRISPDNLGAWRNGAVERLRPGSDPSDASVCLIYDKRIVSNLPVSNHDHSVNGLEFLQNGDLLISVGGSTNAGLPGYRLGGIWETQLSGAVLVAKLSKGIFFDGDIKYSDDTEPRRARQISGDVDVYASGIRNMFSLTMAQTEEIYGTDQGPNCGFGNVATTCADFNEERAAAMVRGERVDWPGMVQRGDCNFSIARTDKVLNVVPGSFYGHANIQRDVPSECAYIDPLSDRTFADEDPPANYRRPITLLTSSVTAIRQYRSNHFCGALRGDLILSTFRNGRTYRLGVSGNTRTSPPEVISSSGGITFVENAQGDLIFPRLTMNNILVLRPVQGAKAGLFISGAAPMRHGRAGGTLIVVGGNNFGLLPSVFVGDLPCHVIISSNTQISCSIPANPQGGLVSLSVHTLEGERQSLSEAVLYMSV